jgi:CheY-like chemotaxis protein
MHLLLAVDMGLSSVTIFEDSTNFQTQVQKLNPRPDVIFLDIHVRPSDGFEMLDILRSLEDFNKVPVVALTASVMNEEVERLRTAGFNGCLAKPIDAEAFPDILQHILKGETIWRIMD